MVSIVEVQIFDFLPFSNWPDFDQKWSKIGHFEHQIVQRLCLKLCLDILEHKS